MGTGAREAWPARDRATAPVDRTNDQIAITGGGYRDGDLMAES